MMAREPIGKTINLKISREAILREYLRSLVVVVKQRLGEYVINGCLEKPQGLQTEPATLLVMQPNCIPFSRSECSFIHRTRTEHLRRSTHDSSPIRDGLEMVWRLPQMLAMLN